MPTAESCPLNHTLHTTPTAGTIGEFHLCQRIGQSAGLGAIKIANHKSAVKGEEKKVVSNQRSVVSRKSEQASGCLLTADN